MQPRCTVTHTLCCHCHHSHTHSRFLYDDRGSQLYEQITQLPEYYPYRTERQLLEQHADAIASQLPGAGGVVVELGCGDGSKTALLLAALLRRHGRRGVRFCGIDCSAEALRQTQRNLKQLLPELPEEQVLLPGRPRAPPPPPPLLAATHMHLVLPAPARTCLPAG